MIRSHRSLLLASLFALAACTGAAPVAPADAAAGDALPAADAGGDALPAADAEADAPSEPDVPAAVAAMIAARPYNRRVPSNYSDARAWPLVVVLHGYGATGAVQAAYLGLAAAVERRGFLLAIPDGTLDSSGRRYWNATDACCDFARAGVDDVAYVTAVIDDMAARYRVDPGRVYLVGHSNGGFMSHRMACERADRVAAIVSLAGAAWSDSARCVPARPVAVLQVHGVRDDTIRYEGGTIAASAVAYPSARGTVAAWARLNRCADAFVEATARADYVSEAAGDETRTGRHAGCAAGGAAELWSMENTGHVPGVNAAWTNAVLDWLEAQARR